MAKSLAALKAELPHDVVEEAALEAKVLLMEMELSELRRALRLSQERLAEQLGVKQGAISKLERRTDMYLSTLRDYIRAMGGDLEILARFDDRVVRINQFHDLSVK